MKTPSSRLNKVCLIAHYNSGNGKRLYFDHFWLHKSKVLMSLIFACNLRQMLCGTLECSFKLCYTSLMIARQRVKMCYFLLPEDLPETECN